ncbi:FAD-dependent oxidoreductase [Candidatus Woesearchaeota archaeon]|nr:FAD-dependent oxidoreductase [Nanoarchaeota archaeon]MCB9370022.1 FAD-dependent oxidoreductase [Candidatus Woesearchaeota archaeon]USN44555.1 MAG: FAD-dependent oxidoreductase [Candidatus Woesearchaeota archaeon]
MEEYDVIIVGGGCAGFPAAVYAARFNLNALVIAKELGGLITSTHVVENYPGFISLSGQELATKLEEHVKANNVPIENDIVQSVQRDGDSFLVKTELMEKTYKTKTVILATGTRHKHLDVKGEKELQGKGVSYCATCDGPLFKNKVVAIVGGSDSAAKEAMVLSGHASKVYMLVRNKLAAEPINVKRVEAISNIEVVEGIEVTEICGEKSLTHVQLSREFEGKTQLELGGIFIAIGQQPQNELAQSLDVTLNGRGEVIIDRLSRTNQNGVFAAGDNTDMEWKQGIVGAAEGSIAAYSAFEYIHHNFER